MSDLPSLVEDMGRDLGPLVRAKAPALRQVLRESSQYLSRATMALNSYYASRWRPTRAESLGLRLASTAFLLTWVDPTIVEAEAPRLARRLAAMLSTGRPEPTAFGMSPSMVQGLLWRPFENVLRPDAMVWNPLSRLILNSLVAFFARGQEEGARVNVTAPIGGGKTTLAYWSIYVVFRGLGVDRDTAHRWTRPLITNDYDQAARLMAEIAEDRARHGRQRLFVPALVLDDIGSVFSKYWMMEEDPGIRRRAMALFRAVKISREGIGLLIAMSDSWDSFPKALREGVKYHIDGEKTPDPGGLHTATIWRHKTLTSRPVRRGKTQAWTPRGPEVIVTEVPTLAITGYTGTVHPPMFTPGDAYQEYQRAKAQKRSEILSESLEDERGEPDGDGGREVGVLWP